MRAHLLYNGRAGRGRAQGAAVEVVARVLRSYGFAVAIEATLGPGTASAQAAAAIDAGAEVVFACGGDGTVNEVLQAVVGSSAALGVIPMGSANVLARELGLSMRSGRAAAQYQRWERRSVPVGRLTDGQGRSRYFLAVAGAGPDGRLTYELLGGAWRRWGRLSYYLHALRLFLTRRFRVFAVHYRRAGEEEWQTGEAVCAMAVRVRDLGGIFHGVGRGVSLLDDRLRLVMVRSPASVGLPLWFVTNWLGLSRLNPRVTTALVDEFRCGPEGVAHVQVDGEYAGRLPVHIGVARETVSMLVPVTGRG